VHCIICSQNYPLFLKTVSSDKDLTFYYTVHTSLDVVEEKISSVAKSNNDLRELYLGLLYPMEDYKVYPFVIDLQCIFRWPIVLDLISEFYFLLVIKYVGLVACLQSVVINYD